MSPTARSLAHLKTLGYQALMVEKWNPFGKIRQDVFSGDLIGTTRSPSLRERCRIDRR